MVYKSFAVVALLFAVGCTSQPQSGAEFLEIETQPPAVVQVDGQPYQAPTAVLLDTHNEHVVTWPDGTQTLVQPAEHGWFVETFMPGLFPAFDPNRYLWVEGHGVVAD